LLDKLNSGGKLEEKYFGGKLATSIYCYGCAQVTLKVEDF